MSSSLLFCLTILLGGGQTSPPVAADAPTRVYLYMAATPGGFDSEGSARRLETLADIRRLLLKDPQVILTEQPDEASVMIELTARRLVRTADDRTVATIDLRLSAGATRAEVSGAATRPLAVWKDAASHAVEAAVHWIGQHAGVPPG